ncbi:MAG: type II toxin-antitoxin system RelE/ParE family toxin [Proteobacteria bacterium]|nr:type II toxin-antitoxin system RelE/ParE family toxin [Pseudomonadota bacterium]
MTWRVDWDDRARKELRQLDYPIQKKILQYMRERVTENPRNFGKELSGNKAGLWRYRFADIRIVCKIDDAIVTVLVLRVGHRKNVYI